MSLHHFNIKVLFCPFRGLIKCTNEPLNVCTIRFWRLIRLWQRDIGGWYFLVWILNIFFPHDLLPYQSIIWPLFDPLIDQTTVFDKYWNIHWSGIFSVEFEFPLVHVPVDAIATSVLDVFIVYIVLFYSDINASHDHMLRVFVYFSLGERYWHHCLGSY